MSDYSTASAATLAKFKTGLKDLGSKVKTTSAAAGKTLSEQVTVVSGKMKELFYTPTVADKFVDDATTETLSEPDWGQFLLICDKINSARLSSFEVVRAIKRRLAVKSTQVQLLSVLLLEATAKNCERIFSDISQEKLLDELVKIADDPVADPEVRDKILKMIEAWGESTEHLRFLPVFEETYKVVRLSTLVFLFHSFHRMG